MNFGTYTLSAIRIHPEFTNDPFYQIQGLSQTRSSAPFWIDRDRAIQLIKMGAVIYNRSTGTNDSAGQQRIYLVELNGKVYLRTDHQVVGEDQLG